MRAFLFGVIIFALPVSAIAWTGPKTGDKKHDAHAQVPLGVSIGSPTEGHLVGGAHLDDAPYLRVLPVYAKEDVRWGLGALVALIEHAARNVRRQFPNAVLCYGHLSRAGGGELDRHASHESGRDADIAFFIKSNTSSQLFPEHFVPFRADGTAPSWPGARFDDDKNWALIGALLADPSAQVSHVFVANWIRARLLRYAERMGVQADLQRRAAEVMVQPRGSLPHDDHFHIRISCPRNMSACIEQPTVRSGQRYARVRRRSHREAQAHVAPSQPVNLPPLPQKRSEPPPGMLLAPLDDPDGIFSNEEGEKNDATGSAGVR